MTEQQIQSKLTTKTFGRTIHCFESLPSTNTFAKALCKEQPPEGTLVICDEQTAGRGRLGRPWVGEKGKNLTFSLILKPQITPTNYGIISLYAGLAVAQTIQESTDLEAECKWPNDILIKGKKICGILSETAAIDKISSYIIIGIGMNVNQTDFPGELKPWATSFALETSTPHDRFLLLSQLLLHLETLYGDIQSNQFRSIIDSWKHHCRMFGKPVTIDRNGERMTGIAVTVNENGALILRANEQDIPIHSGDVTIIR